MTALFLSWLGVHWAFIALSYGIAAVVLAATVLLVVADVRSREHELAALDAKGIRRRSVRAAARLQGGS